LGKEIQKGNRGKTKRPIITAGKQMNLPKGGFWKKTTDKGAEKRRQGG